MGDLRTNIEAAFADALYPGDESLPTCRCQECTRIRDYFRGAHWRGHTLAQLRQVETAIFHFSPEAFQFFLPAFLLATLENLGSAEAIPDLIIEVLNPAGVCGAEAAKERVKTLSSPQRQAVAQFLDYLLESGAETDNIVAQVKDHLLREFGDQN